MSDTESENLEMNIDPDHPWVMAAMNVPMQPTPSAVNLDEAELTIDGKQVKAALLTVADPSGVRTAFLPPSLLANLVQQGIDILREWDAEKQQGLVIARPGVDLSKIQQDLRGGL